MSSITYWTECQGETGCGHTSYTKDRLGKCEICGNLDVISTREWDEEGDYPKSSRHSQCTDEWGDNCPEYEG